MVDGNPVAKLFNFIAWLTGIIVSLAVGFGLTDATLKLPTWLGGTIAVGLGITLVAGWIVIVLTIAGAIIAILNRA